MVNPERRKHKRVQIGQRCWCESGSITIYALIQDLSEGGLFIRTSALLYEGASTKVRWSSPHSEKEIEARAEVVWQRDRDSSSHAPAGMGLKINSIDESSIEIIRKDIMDHSD